MESPSNQDLQTTSEVLLEVETKVAEIIGFHHNVASINDTIDVVRTQAQTAHAAARAGSYMEEEMAWIEIAATATAKAISVRLRTQDVPDEESPPQSG